MSTRVPSGEPPAGRAPTLGELLYAGQTQTPVSESDWVALVAAIAAQDRTALRILYERTHHIVFTLVVRITGDRRAAEELTLDVFDHVWRQASSYDPATGTVLAWIMNDARRIARSRIRPELAELRPDAGAQKP